MSAHSYQAPDWTLGCQEGSARMGPTFRSATPEQGQPKGHTSLQVSERNEEPTVPEGEFG